MTTIIGPLVGGFLVDTVSWRAAFLLNVPLVLAAVWATRRHVVETTVEDARRFDWTGAAVVALAVGGLTFGLIRGQERQWADPLGWGSLAVGAAAAILFPLQQRRSAQPLVPAHLFRSRNFVVTNVSTVLIYGALYSLLYFLTIFLQGTRGYNAAAAGLATIPGLLLLAVFSSRFGKLSARFGPRWFMAAGPGLMAVGAGWLARMPDGVGPWTLEVGRGASWAPPPSYLADVLPGVLLFGAGAMIMVAPLTTALMTSVPTENSGIASAVNNAVSRVGPQLAGALIFVAVTASFYGNLVEAVPDLPVAAPSVRAELAPLNPPGPEVAPAVAAAARDASAAAFRLAMLAAAGLLVAGAAVNGVWIRNPGAAEPAREGTSVAGQMCVPAAEGSQARSAG